MVLKTFTILVLTLSIACHAESSKRPYKYSEELVKKAESGDVEAQNDLGVCYAEGLGINQNYAEAVKWFQKAVDQGLRRDKR